MGKTKVTDLFVYRHRYAVGYILLAVAIISLLFLVGVLSPGGVSVAEQQSVVASTSISPLSAMTQNPTTIINAPYHLLQKVSIDLLGMSTLSIKLPSLILGGLAILALHGLLRLWFRRNVALITSIIAASTGLFLFTTQEGTPAITYFFWNITLLWTVSMLTRGKDTSSLWLIVAAVLAAYSLYTPLQIYIIAGLVITCLIHPHARFVIFRRPLWALIGAGVTFLLFVTPLIISIIMDTSVLKALLAIPNDLALISHQRADLLTREYLGFWKPSNGAFITPAYGLALALTALIGVYRLFTAKYTAKSYILTTWLILTLPIIIFVPSAASFTLLPVVLLLAFAIDYLIRSWYRLFPYNPYARAAGLLPLAVLMVSLSIPCIERMAYGYHYSTAAAAAFTKDLSLLDSQGGVLVVPDTTKKFYQAYAQHRNSDKKLVVVSSLDEARRQQQTAPNTPIILDRSLKPTMTSLPNSILVSSTTEAADRFYVYTNTSI